MRHTYTVVIASCVAACALSAQSTPVESLEAKVKQELGVLYRDKPRPSEEIEVRLRKLGDQKAVVRILIDFINKGTDLIDDDFRPGNPDPDSRYRNLRGAISALGRLHELDAIPALTMVASRASKTSELEVLAVLSIAQIDPAGNIPLLRDALQNPQYIVRLSAAEGLSKTDDQSIMYELNVVAARESNPGCRREIQALADAMQTRLRNQPAAR